MEYELMIISDRHGAYFLDAGESGAIFSASQSHLCELLQRMRGMLAGILAGSRRM
jgi:hypothetical protein